MSARRHVLVILLHLYSSLSIYNGGECNPESFKFVVQLIGHKKNKTVKCSGTLIKLDTVLTAAHCVQKFRGSIYAEPKALLQTSKGDMIIGTKKIHIHEKYDQVDLQFDIAILILEEYFSPSEAATINLPVNHDSSNVSACMRGTFLGWGKNEYPDIGADVKPSNGSLSCIDLAVIPQEKCSLLRNLAKFDTYFCTYPVFEKVGGGCIGDSGGPFLCDGVQYGIASANFGCGIRGEPTYFTKIEKALDFIGMHVMSFASNEIRDENTKILQICSIILLICHQ